MRSPSRTVPARLGHETPSRPALALGAHARWWARLDDRCRRVLLEDRREHDLPVDVWGTCLASAHAEELLDSDGWLADVSTRRLPFPAAAFVTTLRHVGP